MYYKYLLAASGSALVASVFGLVDAMMVGQYHGPAGNAALAVFNPLWSIIFSLGLLAGIGGSVLFAHSRGSGDEENAQQYFTLSIICGIILSALAMLFIGLYKEPLFRLFGSQSLLGNKLLLCCKSIFQLLFLRSECVQLIISAEF